MAKGRRASVKAKQVIRRLAFAFALALALVLVGGWAGAGRAQTTGIDAGFAAHLPGDNGVLYLLERQGYRISRVY